MVNKVKVVKEIQFPQGQGLIISADPERKGDRIEVTVKPYGGRHEEESTVVISLPWSVYERRGEDLWMIKSIPPGVYTIEWRDSETAGGLPVLWFEPAQEEEGEEAPLLVEAPGPLSKDTDAHSPGVEQVLCVCYEGDTLHAWTLIAAKPGDIFTCEEYGLRKGVDDYEATYIGCRVYDDGFVDDFARLDYPPESLQDWLDFLPEEEGGESRKSFLIPCRGPADGVCMVSESEWRKIWKEMHDYVAEKGGKSPGSRPITEPGTYTFEWDDDDGHHVYEMEVIEKRR